MSGKKQSKHEKMVRLVEEDVATIKGYIFDASFGPTTTGLSRAKYRGKKLAQTLDAYVDAIKSNKKSINANRSASIANIASSVRKFYTSLKNGHDIEPPREKIHKNISLYLKDLMESIKKHYQKVSTNPFITWVIGRMTIHRMPTTDFTKFENLFDMADGVGAHKHLKPLIEYQPERYTYDIAEAIHDIVGRSAQEKTKARPPLLMEYMNVLTESDAITADRIAERVRDYFQKKKPLDYKGIYAWSTKLRDALTVLLVNMLILNSLPTYKSTMTPQDIRADLDQCFVSLQKIITRRTTHQIQQRIMTMETSGDEQKQDFSDAQLLALRETFRRKKRATPKKKPVKTTTPSQPKATTPALSAKAPTQARQQQQERKPAAVPSLRQWLRQAPLAQSRIIPNPRFQSLRQRKQTNIPLLKDQVETIARDVLMRAADARAKSIVLVDVRNLGTKRHPGKNFQQKFTQLVRQSDTLLRQQVRIDDARQTISKPFFVFVDQGVLKDGLKVEEVGSCAVRIKVPCVKDADVDCHHALHQQQDQQQLKNPMDDYVLLSLHFILTSYYKQYVEALGGGSQQQMSEIRQFIRRNPGVARYAPDMVRQFRERVAQLHQLHRKIAKDAIKPYILSGDLFRDWILQKNEIPQQQPHS